MLCELEEQILELLFLNLKQSANIDSYLGELENIKEFEKCLNDKPHVLLEFSKESFLNPSTKEVNYKLYLINKTSNKDANYRRNCKFELLSLSEKIDSLLTNSHLSNDKAISIKGLAKFYEGVSEYGYLSIYTKDISLKVQKDLPNISDISELDYEL